MPEEEKYKGVENEEDPQQKHPLWNSDKQRRGTRRERDTGGRKIFITRKRRGKKNTKKTKGEEDLEKDLKSIPEEKRTRKK